MAPDNFNSPYRGYHIIDLVYLELAKISKANSIEKQTAHDGLHQVIGKRHLAYRAHYFKQPFKGTRFIQQHDSPKNSQCPESAGQFIKIEGYIFDVRIPVEIVLKQRLQPEIRQY